MSNQAARNDTPAPLTRAEKRIAKRARQIAWRQTAAGQRAMQARIEGYQARSKRLANISDGELFA